MKAIILTIGILIGLGLPFAIDLVMFGDATPQNVTKSYEDGSFVGCMAGEICND